MKGTGAQGVWRSFIVNAAADPGTSMVEDRRRAQSAGSVTPGHSMATPGHSLAWDPYDVWLKRVKEPRDRREPRSAPR